VSDHISDESKFVQRIATLAIPHHLTILFLAVIEIVNQEPATYLRLANLSSLISAYSIVNGTRLVTGSNWIREVQEVLQAGDQIVCQAEETIIDQEMNQVLLSNALSIALNAPVIVLTGLYTEKLSRKRSRLSALKWWSVALIIIIAWSGLMFFIGQTTTGWVESGLMLSVFIIGMLMVWFWIKRG
jgi:hypothetical protein